MSEVTNELSAPLNDALDRATDSIHELALSPDQEAGAEYLQKIIAYAKLIVEGSDLDLVSSSTIRAVTEAASIIPTQPLEAVSSPRQFGDAILAHLPGFPVARGRDLEQAAKDAAKRFQQSASARLRKVESDAKTLEQRVEAELAALGAQFGSAAADVTQQVAEIRSKVDDLANESKATIEEFISGATEQRQLLESLQSRHQATFLEEQEKRSVAFQDEVKRARDEFAVSRASVSDQANELLVKAQKEFDAFGVSASDQANEVLTEIEGVKERVADLAGLIGSAGTAGRFGQEAHEQRKVANRYRWLTVIFAVAAVSMAVFATVHQTNQATAVASKLAVSLVFGGIATYTARQSGRHRAREERARNLELELAAFRPFIEPLEDDLQQVELVAMTRRTFGHITPLPETEEQEVIGATAAAAEFFRRRAASDEEPPTP